VVEVLDLVEQSATLPPNIRQRFGLCGYRIFFDSPNSQVTETFRAFAIASAS